MVTNTWNSTILNDSNRMIRLKKKLQILKKEIRVYVADQKKKQFARVNDLKSKLSDIDRILDQGGVNDDLLLSRTECMNNLQDVKVVDARDSIQKAKIQWAVEGDENSKFFHGIVNRKRANLAVKGIMIDGDWVDDPSRVKDEFRNHFAARFQDPGICHGCLASKNQVDKGVQQGGLGVSSFYALNRALLVKWVWRFLSRDNSLWARIIHAIHGLNGQELSASHSSTWSSIVKEINILKTQGIDIISHCKIRVGNGRSTSFWNDLWIGDSCFRYKFPRLYALDINKECTVADKMVASFTSSFRREVRGGAESLQLTQILDLLGTVILSNMEDRWIWDLNGDGEFCVKDVRNLLDVTFLPKADSPTRWIKTIPIKVNIFAWKVSLDRLPTRSNLARRGVLVPSSSCLICNVSDEDLAHLLFRCDLAIEALRMNSRSKSVLEGVFYTAYKNYDDVMMNIKGTTVEIQNSDYRKSKLQKLKEKNSDRVRIPPMKRKKIKQVSWISGDVQNNQIDQNASHLASTSRFHRAVICRPSECVDIVTTDCRAKFVVGFCVQYCVGESQQRAVGSSCSLSECLDTGCASEENHTRTCRAVLKSISAISMAAYSINLIYNGHLLPKFFIVLELPQHGLSLKSIDQLSPLTNPLFREVHDNICKFAKNGLAPSEIGVILRDSHGIAQVNSLTGSKILRILKSHGLATEMPEDLYHLIKKAIAIRKLYNVFTAIRAFRIMSPSEGLPP
ncbi:RNA-directed DNA polymerase, eukaryota [Tanacetum coccineum]